jgi:DUF971 family protein
MRRVTSIVSEIFPTELRVREQGRVLSVTFSDDASFDIAAELMRVESPSAEVKGHGPGEEQLQWGKRHVTISRVEAVGNYAVRIVFSDGHSSGIFTWTYLAKLGLEGAEIFAAYEAKLKAAGLAR